MSSLQFGKHITIMSYRNGEQTNTKEQYEVPVFTTREELPKEIFDALRVITSKQTTKLELEIKVDSQGRYQVIKKWTI